MYVQVRMVRSGQLVRRYIFCKNFRKKANQHVQPPRGEGLPGHGEEILVAEEKFSYFNFKSFGVDRDKKCLI